MEREEKYYVVKLITTNLLKEWQYEPNSEVITVIKAKSKHGAEVKAVNKFFGSEYPNCKVYSITECDNSLFSPIL